MKMSPYWFSVFFLPLVLSWLIRFILPYNVCNTYLGYLGLDSEKNCYYTSDIYMDTPEIIAKYTNGSLEVHQVTTLDGYILTMFRIPRNIEKSKGTILMEHPLITDSSIWMSAGNESLPLLLWRMGYDVWLGNARGTFYSRNHTHLTVSDYKYWNFSFHEMGLYDFKAQIDFVRAETNNSQVILMGHSMACTSALIYASLRPQEAQQSVKLFILMAPPASMWRIESPLKYLATAMPLLQKTSETFEIGEVIGLQHPVNKVLQGFFSHTPLGPAMVTFGFSAMFGWTPRETDPAMNVFFYTHCARGFSFKTVFHYLQFMLSGDHFSMYDYGSAGNMEMYGAERPPDYPLGNISSPIWIIYGEYDSIVVPQDVEVLFNQFSEQARYGKLMVPGFNHGDFLSSSRRVPKLYEKIFKVLQTL